LLDCIYITQIYVILSVYLDYSV
jgi:hypothetical protein